MARIGNAVLGKKNLVTYRYSALTPEDKTVGGTIKASDEAVAEQLLNQRGYRVFNIEVASSSLSLERLFPSFFSVKLREITTFSRQLATLLEAGMPLTSGLEILGGKELASRGFIRIIGAIINDLRTGNSFAQALLRHPKVFSSIYCRTTAVGERSGGLIGTLRRLADYMEGQSKMTKKLKGAMTYPAIVLSVGLVVVVVMVTFVLPSLVGMFSAMGANLPLPTKILIAITNFATAYKFYVFGALVLPVAFVLVAIKQPAGRRLLDRLMFKIPIMGPANQMGELARFARAMAILLGSGLSLQEIMEMMPQLSGNSFFRNALEEVREGLILGAGLSGPMSHNKLFPPLMVQMVAVGEASNTIGANMDLVATFYEATAEEKLNAMVGLISPVSIMFLAGMVGFIALSIIMPMYSITGAFE